MGNSKTRSRATNFVDDAFIGAVASAGYSFYSAYHHPERYEGCGALRAFGNTVGGTLIGGVSALAGEALLGAHRLSGERWLRNWHRSGRWDDIDPATEFRVKWSG